MNENHPNRAEAERLLGVAEKLLQSRDLSGTRDFAVLAQETEPLLEGSDQILAVSDVLLSAERRINNHHDWYSILQIGRRTDDNELIKKQYRRLALLLHPDKNKYPFADQAFKLVADAWAVLSDSGKKTLYDNELNMFARIDLSSAGKLPVRRSQRPTNSVKKYGTESAKSNVSNREDQTQRAKLSSFWTACPYCYILYEYPRVYEDCCLRCQNCQRAFHAALIPSLPPLVPGKEAYYCCWGFFPLGFVLGSAGSGGKGASGAPAGTRGETGFPNWMPPMFGAEQQVGVSDKSGGGAAAVPSMPKQPTAPPARVGVESRGGVVGVSHGSVPQSMPRKRGRPRKYPVQV